jgi:hypothetical protein
MEYGFYEVAKKIEDYYKNSNKLPIEKLKEIDNFLDTLVKMGEESLNEKIKENKSGVLELYEDIKSN